MSNMTEICQRWWRYFWCLWKAKAFFGLWKVSGSVISRKWRVRLCSSVVKYYLRVVVPRVRFPTEPHFLYLFLVNKIVFDARSDHSSILDAAIFLYLKCHREQRTRQSDSWRCSFCSHSDLWTLVEPGNFPRIFPEISQKISAFQRQTSLNDINH